MTSEPLVSVLLPTYNGAHYVASAIESVMSQNYRNWELIVQDDNSTDNTVEVVQQFKDTRITLARNSSNLHIAGNLNSAILRSSGSFVQLLGQDDLLHSDCLSVQVMFWQSNPFPGFVFSPARKIDSRGNRLLEAEAAWKIQHMLTPEIATPRVAMLLFYNFGCLPSNITPVMIRRECLVHVGLFNTNLMMCLDWEMWIRLAAVYGFGYIRDQLVTTRVHDKQESSNPQLVAKRVHETYYCLKLIEDSMASDNLNVLHAGVAKRYGAEFVHSAMHLAAIGQLDESLHVLGLLHHHRQLAAALLYWLLELPSRVMRRLLNRAPYSARQILAPSQIVELIERCGVEFQNTM